MSKRFANHRAESKPVWPKARGAAWAVSLGCTAILAIAPASAQAPAATPPAVAPSTGQHLMDPLTVTARRIAEPIQKVPFSVTAVTGDELRDQNIRDSRDLYRSIPNFNYTDSGIPEANLLNIRGIGSSSALISPSVTYYIDGVPLPQRAFDIRFLDLARIEVLRGPQGTLFGQNSQAGAVSITTNDPTRERSFEVGAEYGSYNFRQITTTASGPVGDKVSVRIAAQAYGTDGDVGNVLFTSPTAAYNTSNLRQQTLGTASTKVNIEAGPDTKITIAGRFQTDRQKPTTGAWIGYSGFPVNSLNPAPQNNIDSGGAALTIVHDFGAAKLTSLTGFQAYALSLNADITDGFLSGALTGRSPFLFSTPNAIRNIGENLTQWTQELRLDGQTAGGTRWVGGLSGLWSSFASATSILSPALANGTYSATQSTANLAAFGEVTVPIIERLRGFVGLRFTHELKNFNGVFGGNLGGAPALSYFSQFGSVSSDFVTGRGGFGYDITQELSAYATVARGEKSGGFPFFNQNASVGAPSPMFRPSSTWSYEIGVRGHALDRKLRINLAGFLNDTTDEQLFTFNPLAGQFSVTNANTRTYGSELELAATPFTGFTLTGAMALLNATVTQAAANSGVVVGNTVPYAPGFTTSLAAQYEHPLEIGRLAGNLFGRVEYQYVGPRAIDPANSYTLDPYSVVNLRAGWMSGSVDVYAYAQNLFNTEYVQSGFRAGASPSGQIVVGGVPGLPLILGVGGRVRF
jgi:iron complex outermembrane receptor protein